MALSDFDMGARDETPRLLGAAGQARGHAVDVASRDAVFSHAQDMQRDVGAVHVFVNNAGAGIVGTVEHLSIEQIEWQLQVNPWRLIHGTKAFVPAKLAQRQGCIVDISRFGVRAHNERVWQDMAATTVDALRIAGRRIVAGHNARLVYGLPRLFTNPWHKVLKRLDSRNCSVAPAACGAQPLFSKRPLLDKFGDDTQRAELAGTASSRPSPTASLQSDFDLRGRLLSTCSSSGRPRPSADIAQGRPLCSIELVSVTVHHIFGPG